MKNIGRERGRRKKACVSASSRDPMPRQAEVRGHVGAVWGGEKRRTRVHCNTSKAYEAELGRFPIGGGDRGHSF